MILNEIAIIIPVYNEANRFDIKEFSFFAKNHSNIYWYFVDDGSTDLTNLLINQLKDSLPLVNIQLLKLETNQGKAEAVRTGVLCALSAHKYSYIGFIDGDLQIPLKQIPKLYKAVKSKAFDMAFSVRDFRRDFNVFKYRSVISYGMFFLNKSILNFEIPIRDSQCGCKLFSAHVAELLFNDPFISNWLFDIEILLRYKKSKHFSEGNIIQVPLQKLNKSRDSKLKILENLHLIFDFIKIKRSYQ